MRKYFQLWVIIVAVLFQSCEKRDFIEIPAVKTEAVAGVKAQTAQASGKFIDRASGISDHGFCWSTNNKPTISDSKISLGAAKLDGVFTATLASLNPGTSYYVSAYAKSGEMVVYGLPVSFKTLPDFLPADGLVAWYPFNGNANDESGNNNNAVIYGAIVAADRFNNSSKSFSFNGKNQYIDLKPNPNLAISPISIAGWFNKTPEDLVHDHLLVRLRWSGYAIYLNTGGKLGVNFHVRGKELKIISNSNYIDGKWHHFAVTYDNKTLRLWIDGNFIAGDIGSSNILDYAFGTIAIGRDGDADGGYFKGTLDDFAFWNRALTQDEIFRLFKANY